MDEGLTALYEEAFPSVYRSLVTLGARPHEAEDALHDAFTKLIERGPHGLAQIGRADGWLFVVAVRAWRRRRLRDRLFAPLRDAQRVEQRLDDEVQALVDELARLPRRQREVLVARYVLGLSQEETAAALGIARGTVSAAATKAAATLRVRLGGAVQ